MFIKRSVSLHFFHTLNMELLGILNTHHLLPYLSIFMDLSADSNSPLHIQVLPGATRKKIPRALGVLPT